jgi:hypothetical protein
MSFIVLNKMLANQNKKVELLLNRFFRSHVFRHLAGTHVFIYLHCLHTFLSFSCVAASDTTKGTVS